MSDVNHNLLVLGASGLLGSQLLSGAYLKAYNYLGQGRGRDAEIKADLQDLAQVEEMLSQIQPQTIINLVGLTNVDLCEQLPNEAYRVNVRTLQNVITAGRSLPCKPRLIHISTDQVYDGFGPHFEPNVVLTNYYAFSKYAAELVACAEGGLVLRTNFFGKSRTAMRASLTDWLYKELSAGNEIKVFDDVLFSPLSMDGLCKIIETIVETNLKGVYNLGSRDGLSKSDFAFRFAECVGLPTANMKRVNTIDVDFIKTYRPKDMRMNVSTIEKSLGIKLPKLESEIKHVAQEYLK